MFTKLPNKASSNPRQVYVLPSGTEEDLLKIDQLSLASFLDGAVTASSRGLTMFVPVRREPWLAFVIVRQQLIHLLHLSSHNHHIATNKRSSITSFIFKHHNSVQLASNISFTHYQHDQLVRSPADAFTYISERNKPTATTPTKPSITPTQDGRIGNGSVHNGRPDAPHELD